MIEVFTTNIPNKKAANQIISNLKTYFPDLQIDFDIEAPIINYPYHHSILRVEGIAINSQQIISILNKSSFKCHILT